MDYPVNGPQHVAIAAIQFNPRDDKVANIDKALSLIDQAASSGARLVVLPEIWTYMGDQSPPPPLPVARSTWRPRSPEPGIHMRNGATLLSGRALPVPSAAHPPGCG